LEGTPSHSKTSML